MNCSNCNKNYPLYLPRNDIVVRGKLYECFVCKTIKCGHCNQDWIPHCSRRALRLYFCSTMCSEKYEEMD